MKGLTANSILIINGGSSSIKFALYEMEESLNCLLSGKVENIGTKEAQLIFTRGSLENRIPLKTTGYSNAANFLIDWIEKQESFSAIRAVGHRIVHGMKHTEPELVTQELLAELKDISMYAPEHLPGEIKLIEIFIRRYPELVQIACFDTSFHTSMPAVAKLLPVPRRFYERGVRRYGFHGLSYAYLVEELQRIESEAAQGRVIIAHLGNGASLAAIREGKSVDTSMGFTPTAGIPMSTRTGDLDPGVAWYLMKTEKLSPQEFSDMINHESGLLGISEISSDMRELIDHQRNDPQAAEAIGLFCYQTKKWIGSFAAVLGGIDILVFSGGIGENAPEIRARICEGLQFLGIELEESKNLKNESVISSEAARVKVRVMKTNEELMIARSVSEMLKYSIEH